MLRSFRKKALLKYHAFDINLMFWSPDYSPDGTGRIKLHEYSSTCFALEENLKPQGPSSVQNFANAGSPELCYRTCDLLLGYDSPLFTVMPPMEYVLQKHSTPLLNPT